MFVLQTTAAREWCRFVFCSIVNSREELRWERGKGGERGAKSERDKESSSVPRAEDVSRRTQALRNCHG